MAIRKGISLRNFEQEHIVLALAVVLFAAASVTLRGFFVADNLIAKDKAAELTPFAYSSKGSLASLGMSKAVAEVYGIKLSGFLAWLLWRGFYLSFLPGFATKVRVLVFAKVALPEQIARSLECATGAPALKIVRVRSDNQTPFSYTTCYLPEPEADLISEESLGNRTVIATLAAAGVAAATAEQRLSATVAGVEVAKFLKLEVGAPQISMTRVVRNEDGRPVELIQALYRPDKYEYRVNLSRDNGGEAPRWTVKM